ncbi:NAD(P)/FAD-dependent oxidoreductase [Bauldia sp.]|uniref:NAD(P)/FAD-dependent oxidoreductase n=1 Tax=Bauldia sp. TaxID=2575872 RepID=UPI003BAA5384
MDFDVIIVGASFAGLVAAKTAAARGLSVAVIDAKREPGARVHTTGILVREAIDEIDLPAHLTQKVPGVRLYAPNLTSVDLFRPGYAFYTTRTAALLRWLADEARAAGAHLLYGVRFEGARAEGNGIRLDGIDLRARYLIGADGARSRVAQCFGLDANRRFLTGLEVAFEPGDAVDRRFLHCFLSASLAPGYIAWAAPGPDAVQVGLAVRDGRKPDLAAFLDETRSLFDWDARRIIDRRSGLIPCGGPLRRTSAPGVLLIGDAAGWVSPLTGGGIRFAFRLGRKAAAYIADHLLNAGPAPETLLAREVPALSWKRAARRAFDLVPPDPFVNLALSTAMVRKAAERVYFHRRSAQGVDREAYRQWLEKEFGKTAALPDRDSSAPRLV